MDTTGVLQQLAAAYPYTPISIATIAVYERALAATPVEELQATVDRLIATARFLPTVAEVRRAHRDLFAMSADERQRAYCPNTLRGIVIGCDAVSGRRDERQLIDQEPRRLETR